MKPASDDRSEVEAGRFCGRCGIRIHIFHAREEYVLEVSGPMIPVLKNEKVLCGAENTCEQARKSRSVKFGERIGQSWRR